MTRAVSPPTQPCHFGFTCSSVVPGFKGTVEKLPLLHLPSFNSKGVLFQLQTRPSIPLTILSLSYVPLGFAQAPNHLPSGASLTTLFLLNSQS